MRNLYRIYHVMIIYMISMIYVDHDLMAPQSWAPRLHNVLVQVLKDLLVSRAIGVRNGLDVTTQGRSTAPAAEGLQPAQAFF